MQQRHDETTLSYRKTFVHPLGLVCKSNTKIALIAISGHSVVEIPVIKEKYTESAFGASYNYMNGYDVTKYRYKIGTKRNYFLLSTRDEEILMHYKWDNGFKSVEAYDLLEDIIQSMKSNLEEPPKGFVMVNEFNDQIINLMVTNNAKVESSMCHLVKTEKTSVEINEENLKEAILVLEENLRLYKVWRQQ